MKRTEHTSVLFAATIFFFLVCALTGCEKGVVVLSDAPKDVGAWDFLLGPIILIRRELDLHKQWLVSKGTDLRRVEKNYHVRMLGDLLEKCQREIITCWYEEAKRSLSAHQLEIVRQKVKDAFGMLPPEMVKDENK